MCLGSLATIQGLRWDVPLPTISLLLVSFSILSPRDHAGSEPEKCVESDNASGQRDTWLPAERVTHSTPNHFTHKDTRMS